MIPTLAVAGGADGRTRSTVAANLAVAFSALGHDVEIVDRDGALPLLGALAGSGVQPQQPVVLAAGARLGVTLRPITERSAALRLIDAGSTLDEATLEALGAATVVVVPLDATAESRRALDQIAQRLDGRAGALSVVLSRLLPRAADRWSLVDDLDERYAGSLSAVTLPMGRRDLSGAARRGEGATLFAPTGRAAKAYLAVARELAPRLGLAEVPDRL